MLPGTDVKARNQVPESLNTKLKHSVVEWAITISTIASTAKFLIVVFSDLWAVAKLM